MFGETGEYGWIGLSNPLDLHHYDNYALREEIQMETVILEAKSRNSLIKYFSGLRARLFGEDKKWKSVL